MFDEGRELPAERPGVLLIQIDLVLRAAQPEPHRLVCRTSVKIVFKRDSYPRCHPDLPDLRRAICTVQTKCHAAITAMRQPPAAPHECTRQAAAAIGPGPRRRLRHKTSAAGSNETPSCANAPNPDALHDGRDRSCAGVAARSRLGLQIAIGRLLVSFRRSSL